MFPSSRKGEGKILEEILTALVEAIHPEDVILTHLGGSSNLYVWVGDGNNGWLSVPREGKPARIEPEILFLFSATLLNHFLLPIVQHEG